MLDFLGNDPEGQGLCLGGGILLSSAVNGHAWKLRHVGNPPAVSLAQEADSESHWLNYTRNTILG